MTILCRVLLSTSFLAPYSTLLPVSICIRQVMPQKVPSCGTLTHKTPDEQAGPNNSHYYSLNEYVPPNLYDEILTSDVMG